MDLRNYLRLARKNWWMLSLGVVLGSGIAGLVNTQMSPQYATEITFFVTTPNSGATDAYQGGLFSQQRVKSYATLLTGDQLANEIARQPGINLSPADIRARISAEPMPETVLLKATVIDTSSKRSQLIATGLAREFPELIESLETPRNQAASPVKVEVVAGPQVSDGPVAPRPVRNLALAALLGLVGGVAAAMLREVLDTTVKTIDTLRELTGAPVLAAVPFDPKARSGPDALTKGHSPRAEALRQLRTNLQFVDVDRPIRTLVVTSAVPGEGKSSTACTLALLFAEAGQRVVIVDADLRRPRIAHYLGLEGAAGLTTVLTGRATVNDVLQGWGEGLWVLASGLLPPNPSELLGSRQMANVLDHLRDTFDMVIVDCPPLLPVTDGAVVAARADGALLLAHCGKTSGNRVVAARQALQSVGARLLGCVFNMVPAKGYEGYYYEQYAASNSTMRSTRPPRPATGDAARPGQDFAACGTAQPPRTPTRGSTPAAETVLPATNDSATRSV